MIWGEWRKGKAMRSWYRRFGKRALDIVLSTMALVVFSPVALVVALVIRLTMGSPVIFRQVRPGLHGKPFVMYKFRTMVDLYDQEGNPLPDAKRLTKLGRLIRWMSLDEIPEFWNVLKGDMSLVGPRPLLMRYEPFFSGEERLRFRVRPGITGLALILGRNDLPWDERLAADVRYVKEVSFLLDLQILILTIWRVLTRAGLRVDPGAVMEDLDVQRSRTASTPGERERSPYGASPGCRFVRPAMQGDAEAIHRILAEALPPRVLSYTIYQSPLAVNYLRYLLSGTEEHRDTGLFVAECEGEVVGCYRASRSADSYFLSYLAVTPVMQRRGIGSALLRHFEYAGAELGCKTFSLDVFESNRHALNWYVSQAYQEVGATHWCQVTALPAVSGHSCKLVADRSEVERAKREEERQGFSRIECSCCGGKVIVGLIGGRLCKVLHYEGCTLEAAVSSILERFRPERDAVIVTGLAKVPASWRILDRDRVIRLEKGVQRDGTN